MYYTLTIKYPTNDIKYWKVEKDEAKEIINSYLELMNANYIVKDNTFANLMSRPSVMPKIIKYFVDNQRINLIKYDKVKHMEYLQRTTS